MAQNPFFKPDVYSFQFTIRSDDAFNFIIKFIRKENGVVIVLKPNKSKIHMTLFIDNNEFESHLTEDGKKKVHIPYTETKGPFGDLIANYLDYERYNNSILKNLKEIKPKEKLYYINNPLQFYTKILLFLIENKTYVIDIKESQKGYKIELSLNMKEDTFDRLSKLIFKDIKRIKARKLLKISNDPKIFLEDFKTRDGKSVVIIHDKLYGFIKTPIVDDLKHIDFQNYDFIDKYFDIIKKIYLGLKMILFSYQLINL